jgi:DNA recombination protein Rad52
MVAVEPDVLEALAEPLDAARVKMVEARGGRKQPYLETWDVKAAANRIFGYDGWGYTPTELRCIGEERFQKDGKDGCRVGYIAVVFVEIDGFIEKADVGYGDATEYGGSMITCHELAAKEAVSDGLKRALTSLGDQFGLALYNKASGFHTASQPAQKPRPVDQSLVRDAVARLGLEQDVAVRVQAFVMRGDAVTTPGDVDSIVQALGFYAENPEEAERQITAWEGGEHAESV